MDKRKRFKLTLEIFRDIFKICPRVQGQDFDALPTDEEIMSFLRELGHTGESIHSLMLFLIRCINLGELLLLSLTDGKTTEPIKKQREDYHQKEPTKKSKRLKRPAKKSTKAPAGGVVIKETPKMPLSKKKEKMTVEKRNGIDLLSEVALTKEAQYEEASKKSLRAFHKTHPSGSGTIIKTAPSAAKIKPSVTNEGTGVKTGVPDVTEEESSKSEAKSWGNDGNDSNDDQDSSGEDSDQENDSDDDKTQSDNENESDSEHETDENESGSESDQEENEEDIGDDEEEVKDELVKTPSNDSDDEDETKITDKAEGDEDEEMDYTTSQLYDDVDIWLNKPVQADDETVQKEGTDAELTNIQQGNENPDIPSHRRCS
ncbi:hypothetical protein Tco_1218284 [Tanacetum coccineum]